MRNAIVLIGLLTISTNNVVAADSISAPTPGNVVISTALDASCFAKSAAQALTWTQQAKWWLPLGFKSAEEALAAALGNAVAGISFNMQFNAAADPVGGAVSQVDFQTNIDNATLVLAATSTQTSASLFARTWRNDFRYAPQSKGIAWVTDAVHAGPVRAAGALGQGSAGAGNTVSTSNKVFVSGTSIDTFHNQLGFTAYSWGSANSASYATLFSKAAAARGWRVGPLFAFAVGRALSQAVAEATTQVNVDVLYEAANGSVEVNDAKVTLVCGSGASATTQAFAVPN